MKISLDFPPLRTAEEMDTFLARFADRSDTGQYEYSPPTSPSRLPAAETHVEPIVDHQNRAASPSEAFYGQKATFCIIEQITALDRLIGRLESLKREMIMDRVRFHSYIADSDV